ncbi:hypothetical protein O181_001651 [Austropuccinia psidii MF-1]|uniref:Uncharacterized protein n=1 Tax=Austropuccinia psidii MF-1 TaxID=1389203 RepID=A0A9Q3GCL6_9BASI|nr:hypothetical protein [Austropuccinia psidii MF-1]
MVVIGQNWVLKVLRAILGLMRFGAKIGSDGPNCGHGPWTVDRDYGPRNKEWLWLECPEPPKKQEDTSRPKNKDKDLGVGDIEELAREAKDGSRWPEAITGQGRVIWKKCHTAPEGTKLAIKIWCGQLAPTWSQVRISATPMEEGQSLWL